MKRITMTLPLCKNSSKAITADNPENSGPLVVYTI